MRGPRQYKTALLGLLLVPPAGLLLMLTWKWPFTEERVVRGFANSTRCDVRAAGFERKFFPRPGCALTNVMFTRGAGAPLAVTERIELETSWWNLLTFRKRLTRVETTRLRLRIPIPVPPASPRTGQAPQNIIAELIADATTLEIVPAGAVEPLSFRLHQLRLREVGPATEIGYSVEMDIPHPPGSLKATGSTGPFQTGQLGTTPASGRFELTGGRLDAYSSLRGVIGTKGAFRGILSKLRIDGEADVRGFGAHRTSVPVDIHASYHVAADGTSGDVTLESADAGFLQSSLKVTGNIARSVESGGKEVTLQFASRQARIEDLTKLATRSGNSALNGPISLDARVRYKPGERPFVEHVRLDGSFAISSATWKGPRMQAKVNALSARARGEKEAPQTEERVLTNLKGFVTLRGGTAFLREVTFAVPGALASGSGTFHLPTRRVDLRGTVSMDANLSEATSGLKSVVLKPFNFLFRRKGDERGAVLPVRVSGTFPRPRYSVTLRK